MKSSLRLPQGSGVVFGSGVLQRGDRGEQCGGDRGGSWSTGSQVDADPGPGIAGGDFGFVLGGAGAAARPAEPPVSEPAAESVCESRWAGGSIYSRECRVRGPTSWTVAGRAELSRIGAQWSPERPPSSTITVRTTHRVNTSLTVWSRRNNYSKAAGQVSREGQELFLPRPVLQLLPLINLPVCGRPRTLVGAPPLAEEPAHGSSSVGSSAW